MESQPSTSQEPSTPPNAEQQAQAQPAANGHRASFVRRHPALTVIGAAGVGLLAGPELALGVLLGAGVAMLARGRAVDRAAADVKELGEKTQQALSPDEVRKRARAMMQAARGKLQPSA